MKVDLSCPIELSEYELPTAERPFNSFTFFNLGEKTISSIQITVTCFDADDNVISRRVERPMALEAPGRELFIVQLLTDDTDIDAVDLSIDKVWFIDGAEWRRQQDVRLVDYEPNELPPNRELEQLRYIAGNDAVGFPSDQGNVWMCVCGRVNGTDEHECRRCGRDRDVVFQSYSKAAVNAVINVRERELEEKARQAREEASRKEFLRQDAIKRKKRARRTRTAVISVVLALAVVGYLFFVLALPELRYQRAMSALDSNDFTVAQEGFASLGDYRDAANMVKEAELREAILQANSGDMTQIDQAIATMESLGEYPDAVEMTQEAKIQKARLYIKGNEYEEASALMATMTDVPQAVEVRNQAEYALANQLLEAKDYEAATEHFAGLGQYLDAAAMAKESIYRPAMEALNANDYDEAMELFGTLVSGAEGTYKDANEQWVSTVYKAAMQAQLAGEYEYAAEKFALLGNYEDSPAQVIQSVYMAANTARDNGNYETAVTMYESIPDYEDSAAQIVACKYAAAKQRMDAGEYEAAGTLLKDISGYEDADDLYLLTVYEPAVAAMDAGQFDTAIALFKEIPDYSDVAKKLPQAEYSRAEALQDSGELDAAMSAFAALGDYNDAENRMKEIKYSLAQQRFEAGDLETAAQLFGELGKYNDAQERVKECTYQLAMQVYDTGALEEAYDMLIEITDYAPATQKAQETAYQMGETLTNEGDLLGGAEAFAMAGKYQDAAERSQDNVYQAATALMDEGKYQEAGDLFNEIVNYTDAKAKRDISYDMWLSEKTQMAESMYAVEDYQGVIEFLKPLDLAGLPKAYANLATLYYDANLKLARQLIDENRALDAYGYLIAAGDYKNAKELLQKNIYRILGTWETEDGAVYAFFLNGSAIVNGEDKYFNMFNAYGVSIGDDPNSLERMFSFSNGTDTTLQLRREEDGGVIRMKRTKPPEISPTNDSGGAVVVSDEELEQMEDPVVDSFEAETKASEEPEDEETPAPEAEAVAEE